MFVFCLLKTLIYELNSLFVYAGVPERSNGGASRASDLVSTQVRILSPAFLKMKEINKVLFYKDKKYYWSKGDFHSNEGYIKEENIKNGIVKTNTDKEFFISDADFSDKIEKIRRGPQAMMNKDMGFIITTTGIGKDSVVLEAGSGSGKLTAMLANICKKVYSYEQKGDVLKIAKENIKFLNFKNVVFKNQDIKEIKEKNIDVIILDLSNPWDYIKGCHNALKSGGHLAVYVPTITQVNEFVKENKLFHVNRVVELLKRPWFVEGRKVRPNSRMIGHTAFLIFCRK